VATETLEDINNVFARMHRGEIEGRIVLDFENAPVSQPGKQAVAA